MLLVLLFSILSEVSMTGKSKSIYVHYWELIIINYIRKSTSRYYKTKFYVSRKINHFWIMKSVTNSWFSNHVGKTQIKHSTRKNIFWVFSFVFLPISNCACSLTHWCLYGRLLLKILGRHFFYPLIIGPLLTWLIWSLLFYLCIYCILFFCSVSTHLFPVHYIFFWRFHFSFVVSVIFLGIFISVSSTLSSLAVSGLVSDVYVIISLIVALPVHRNRIKNISLGRNNK